jgi:hypothetical protein
MSEFGFVRDYEVAVVRESDSGSGADLFRDFVCQDASPAAHFLLPLAATIMFPRGLSGWLIAQHDWLYFRMLRPRFIFPLSLAATIMFPLGLSGRLIAQHNGYQRRGKLRHHYLWESWCYRMATRVSTGSARRSSLIVDAASPDEAASA